jgi:hypothetical protein
MSNIEDKKKNIEILVRASIVAQTKGSLSLKDASVVHSSIKTLSSKEEISNEKECLDTLIQATLLGQKGGAYSLDDANAIFHSIKWFEENEPKIQEVKEL